MGFERTKNAKRNILYGSVNKIIIILLPFITRTIVIKTIGVEYLGLSSLFTSILTVLSVTELGFSSAIVFNMYKPLAENDLDTVRALLNFYRTVYRILGVIILVLGVAVIPFLPNLIKGSYPEDINILVLYLIYLVNTVASYFLFSYYSSLLNALQRHDIVSNVNSVLSIVRYGLQIVVLLVFKNYYAYVTILPLFTICCNIFTAYYAKKHYPLYFCKGKISKELKKDIKVKVSGMMITKLQGVSRNAFDSIFISMFLGLVDTAIYSNYYYILSSLVGIISVLTVSITAGIGNSVAVESVDKNYSDMNKINFVYMWICSWCTICLLCLYQPFMTLWAGHEMLFPFSTMTLFCVYFYALKIGDIRSVYLETNGLWWENRYKAILEAISNLVLNYFLGKYFGVVGILLATIITILVINFGYGSRIVFKHYFGIDRISEYYMRNLKFFIITAIAGAITFAMCSFIETNIVATLFIRGIICVILPNILFFVMYFKNKDFKIAVPWILESIGITKNFPAAKKLIEIIKK